MSQVWFITGSSRGLGRALAEAVLAAGHKLVATARNPIQLTDLVERYGNQVRAIALDVTDAAAARSKGDRGWCVFAKQRKWHCLRRNYGRRAE